MAGRDIPDVELLRYTPHGSLISHRTGLVTSYIFNMLKTQFSLIKTSMLPSLLKLITGSVVSPEKEITCSSPVVNNSVKSGREVSVHHVGDTINITCSTGFQLDGAQQLTCGSDGQWQPKLPQCFLSPDKRPGKHIRYFLASHIFFFILFL